MLHRVALPVTACTGASGYGLAATYATLEARWTYWRITGAFGVVAANATASYFSMRRRAALGVWNRHGRIQSAGDLVPLDPGAKMGRCSEVTQRRAVRTVSRLTHLGQGQRPASGWGGMALRSTLSGNTAPRTLDCWPASGWRQTPGDTWCIRGRVLTWAPPRLSPVLDSAGSGVSMELMHFYACGRHQGTRR